MYLSHYGSEGYGHHSKYHSDPHPIWSTLVSVGSVLAVGAAVLLAAKLIKEDVKKDGEGKGNDQGDTGSPPSTRGPSGPSPVDPSSRSRRLDTFHNQVSFFVEDDPDMREAFKRSLVDQSLTDSSARAAFDGQDPSGYNSVPFQRYPRVRNGRQDSVVSHTDGQSTGRCNNWSATSPRRSRHTPASLSRTQNRLPHPPSSSFDAEEDFSRNDISLQTYPPPAIPSRGHSTPRGVEMNALTALNAVSGSFGLAARRNGGELMVQAGLIKVGMRINSPTTTSAAQDLDHGDVPAQMMSSSRRIRSLFGRGSTSSSSPATEIVRMIAHPSTSLVDESHRIDH